MILTVIFFLSTKTDLDYCNPKIYNSHTNELVPQLKIAENLLN